MQKVAFTRFGVSRGQESAADLGDAEFQVSSNGCEVGALKASHSENSGKMALSQGIMQSKAANSVFSGVRAVFALSRARVSSLSLSLSRSLFGAF